MSSWNSSFGKLAIINPFSALGDISLLPRAVSVKCKLSGLLLRLWLSASGQVFLCPV